MELNERYRLLTQLLQVPLFWREGRHDLVRELLARAPHQETDFAWHYWNRLVNADAWVLRGQDERINSIDFSPDGARVVQGYESGGMVVWDINSRQSLWYRPYDTVPIPMLQPAQAPVLDSIYFDIKHYYAIHGVGFYPEGNRIWALTHRGELTVWDATAPELLSRQLLPLGGITHVQRSTDRTLLLVSADGGLVHCVALETGEVLQRIGEREWGGAWSNDGKVILTTSGAMVSLWNAATGEAHGQVACAGKVTRVALDTNTETLFTLEEGVDSNHHCLRLWDWRTSKPLASPERDLGFADQLALAPNGRSLAINTYNGTLFWDVLRGDWDDISLPPWRQPHGNAIAFSPTGSAIVVGEYLQALSRERQVSLTLPVFTNSKVLDAQSPDFHLDILKASRFSPLALSGDGKTVAAAASGEIQHRGKFGQRPYLLKAEPVSGYQYELVNQARQFPLAVAGGSITALAYSADDTNLVAGTKQGALFVFDRRKGSRREYVGPLKGPIKSVALSADNAWVAATDASETACVWDLQGGVLYRTALPPAQAVAFSRDSAQLILATAAGVRCLEVTTGTEKASLAGGSEPVRFLSFSPQGEKLLVGGVYEGLVVWDWATGERCARLAFQGLYLSAVGWSPDGSVVATGDNTGVVRLWDVATASLALQLSVSDGPVELVGFVDNGRTLVSANGSGQLRFWPT